MKASTWFLSLSVCALFGCSSDDEPSIPVDPVNPVDSIPVVEFVPERIDTINDFAFMLVRQVNEDGAKSVEGFAFSPISIANMLALLTENASDEVKQQLLQEIGLANTTPKSFSDYIRSLSAELQEADRSVVCRFRNGLYANSSAGYEAATPDNPFARYLSVDFTAPEAADLINANFKDGIWPEGFTDFFFFDIDMTQDSPNVLLNSLRYCAGWENPFDAAETKREVFHGKKGDFEWPTMMQEDSLLYFQDNGLTAVSKPLAGGRFQMTFILPEGNPSEAADKTISELDSKKWNSILSGMKKEAVRMSLPRIQNYTSVLALREGAACDILQKSVLKSNDYPALFTAVGDAGPVVWFARHRENITLNEAGINLSTGEKSGVSVVSTEREFLANRPFVYVIHDTVTRTILFVGKFTDEGTGIPV